MKTIPFTRCFLTLLAGCAIFSAGSILADCHDDDPPPPPPSDPGPPPPNPPPAGDPVFVTLPAMIPVQSAQPSPRKAEMSSNLQEAARLAKALEGIKDLAQAREIAMEAWKASVSVDLQRHALATARSLAKTTEDVKAFDFMLSALADPQARQEECFKLGLGNALEKNLAAERLDVLLQNPNLRAKL